MERYVAFGDIEEGAQYLDVDPFNCIPLFCFRNTTKSVGLQFVPIFTGHGASALGPASAGIACYTDSAIVVRREMYHEEFIIAHFPIQGLLIPVAKEKLKSRYKWYGTVDGQYRHEAISLLVDFGKNWENIHWIVTVI